MTSTCTTHEYENMETLDDNAIGKALDADNVIDAVSSHSDNEDEIGAFQLFGVPMDQMTQNAVTAHYDSEDVCEDAQLSLSMVEAERVPIPTYKQSEFGSNGPRTMTSSNSVGGRMSTPYRQSGNAIDVIAVRSRENHLYTTSWHVMFSWSRFRSRTATGVGDQVRVLINGKELPVKMSLLERGRCIFQSGSLTPPIDAFDHVELYENNANYVRFEHYQKSTCCIRYVECRLYVWHPEESVIIVDMDGTLTVSDVEGHIRTLRLGQYDYLHRGTCQFFTKLHELQMRVLYLTARPLDWATASRNHLENAIQLKHVLPPGPLITNSNGLTGALLTEVVNKNPHIFKRQVLEEIQLCLIHAGRITEHPIFVAGFGNRSSDVLAYKDAGIELDMIFLIDSTSAIKCSNTTFVGAKMYESYDDPNVLLWMLPKLKHRVPFEKVWKIDEYTVRELLYAEEREQILISERNARALQEQEYERIKQSNQVHSLEAMPSL